MIKKIIYILLIINLITISNTAIAHEIDINNITYRNIDNEDGLSQVTIWSILKDSEGYMWFATEDGLNKYNGVEFEVFRYDEESKNSLIDNYINSITMDKNGDLWVATYGGITRIEKNTGKFKTYTSSKKNLSINNVYYIYINSDNDIMIATDKGVEVYNEKEDKFEKIIFSDEELNNKKIFKILQDSKGFYWIATELGLYSYNDKTRDIKLYSTREVNGKKVSYDYIQNIYIDNENYLWVSNYYGGLTRRNLLTGEEESFVNDQKDKKSIPSNDVRAVIRDLEGNVWVGTKKGLVLLDEENKSFIKSDESLYGTRDIINDDIKTLYEDDDGIVWVGTSKGISIFNPNTCFEIYKNNPLNENTLNDDMIFGIYEDKDGLLWIGTANGGVNVLDREDNKVYKLQDYEELKDIITNNSIIDIDGKENEIWISTESDLVYLNKDTKIIKSFFGDDDIFVVNISIDKEGTAWVGTNEGLYNIDRDFNIKSYEDEFIKNNIDDKYVNVTYEDSKGGIWIGLGNTGGLLNYDRKTGNIKQYKNIEGDSTSLSYNSVIDIKEDGNGNIWISTTYGINKLDKETGKFKRYMERDGLANNYAYEILIDDNENLWISTNDGISRFNTQKESFYNFTIMDGLQDREFNKNSAYKCKNGELVFGGIGGINIFKPEEFKENNHHDKLIIDGIVIDGYKKKVEDNIKLKYNEKYLEIGYFLSDYIGAKSIKYFYKLEGVDSNWKQTSNADNIRYTNIEPGKYKLMLAATDSHGQWIKPIEIGIYKSKVPWKSNIAYCIYVIILIAVGLIVWNRVKILDRLVKIKTDQLNRTIIENEALYRSLIKDEINKNNYIINLSHELRTPLNIILSIETLITSLNKQDISIEKKKLEYYMEVLKNNSNRLLKLINDIVDTSKIQAGQYNLNVIDHDIIYHVEEIAFSMKDYIESKGIEFIIEPEMEEKIVECDIDEIEKCMINILGNAAKFTDKGGKIELFIKEVDDTIHIICKDTGIGINKKDLCAIFDRFGQAYDKKSEEYGGSGIGLFLTKQLVELHKGQLLVESELGKGSIFTIVLPIKFKK